MFSLRLLDPFNIADSHESMVQDLSCIVEICAEFPGLKNFSLENWKENPSSLMFKLVNTNDFSPTRGGIFMLHDGRKTIAISGFHKLNTGADRYDPDVYICGVRTLVREEYRHHLLVSTYLIPAQYNEVKKRNGKMMIFCFDASDPFSLYNVYKNGKFNLFLKNKLKNFDEIYGNMVPHDKQVYINYTKHNVLYKKLDPDFNFDWSKIEVKDD